MPVTINGTTGIAGPDGSAATPSLAGADTNTGVFFPAADTVAIATGGTEAVRVDSSRNVGIGTSSPDAKLDVTSIGTAAAYTVTAVIQDGNYPASGNPTLEFNGFIGGNGYRSGIGSIGGQQLAFYTPSTYGVAPTERARIDNSGNWMWNGTNTTTQNGNVGYIYKFFGGNNNLIMPMEVGIVDRYAVLEFRQTGRTNSARASQISIGQNSLNQGDVQVYSSAANADVSGGVRLNNGATSWSAISDMRLKTVTGTYTNALQDLAKIQAIKFTWKHDQSNTPQVGVSAQSVELAVPEAISTSRNIATPDDETDYLAVRYTELIPLMIASIQEQQALITSLTARIAALEGAAQ